MDRQIETGIQAQKVVFPEPLSIDKVQTSKTMASGENSFKKIFTWEFYQIRNYTDLPLCIFLRRPRSPPL